MKVRLPFDKPADRMLDDGRLWHISPVSTATLTASASAWEYRSVVHCLARLNRKAGRQHRIKIAGRHFCGLALHCSVSFH
jgi:hypothetical protein